MGGNSHYRNTFLFVEGMEGIPITVIIVLDNHLVDLLIEDGLCTKDTGEISSKEW